MASFLERFLKKIFGWEVSQICMGYMFLLVKVYYIRYLLSLMKAERIELN